MLGDFIIIFEYNRTPRRIQNPAEAQWDFEQIRDGFWVDKELQLVHERRGHYWIPPSRIILIEKRE